MNPIQEFLKKEVVFLQSNKDKWSLILFMVVFVPLFLLIFQPFGVNNDDPTHNIGSTFLLAVFGFGMVQGFVLIIYEFGIVPFVFKNTSWSFFIVRMLLELLLIVSCTFLYYNILGGFHDWYFKSFLEFVFNISLMSIIPFAIIFLYSNYRKSQKAYQLLELQPQLTLTEKYINLQSYNGKEKLTITLANLLYIEAEDNYISVFHLEKGIVKKQLLRATMKDIEANLKVQFIIRCQRSFIVNINTVEKVKRDGHQMKLYLPHISKSIPVSRSYIPFVESLLDTHHK
jgi:LytTr DNA-binding domain